METKIDIKFLREQLGWTQAQLADWLGVAACSVSRMEAKGRARGPVLRLIKLLANEYGIAEPGRSGVLNEHTP